MEPTHASENGDQKATNSIAINAESDISSRTLGTNPGAAKETSCSSSTSSDDTDEDDFFQFEGPILGNPIVVTDAPVVTSGAPRDGDNGVAGGSKQQKMMPYSSTSPSSATSPEPAQLGVLDPKHSPQAQAMSRASGEAPDPNRIPSSVFARTKSTTPLEWSVASNESLFSINVGNSSFSKDHVFLYGKSGELGGPLDPMAPLPPLPSLNPSSSPMSAEAAKAATQANAKVKAASPKGKADGLVLPDRDGPEGTFFCHSMSHRSDGSTTSFAFPILTNGSLKDEPDLPRQSMAQPPPPAVEPQAASDTPKVAEAQKAEAAPPTEAKWFPWCACCPFCC